MLMFSITDESISLIIYNVNASNTIVLKDYAKMDIALNDVLAIPTGLCYLRFAITGICLSTF